MLDTLGYSRRIEEAFRPFHDSGLVPARVVFESHELYRVTGAEGERLARLAGRLRAGEPASLPVTGDWVATRPLSTSEALVEAVLPRRGAIVRKETGRRSRPQVLAANVDVALVVQPCARVNPRSLERYVALAWDGGALPVVVLSKADEAEDVAAGFEIAAAAAPGVARHLLSAVTGDGLEALAPHLSRGLTAVLLGPSGAGKSTLANALAGRPLLATSAVRAGDGKGRHTTTARQMVPLPSGAWLLDTPGLRELGLAGEVLGFDEIERLAGSCRFRDCRHDAEPGCAVRDAVAGGALDAGRLAGYRKLRRETAWAAEREESTAAFVEKRRWKAVMKVARHSNPR